MTQNKLIEALGVISILAAPKGNPAVALIVLKAIRETAEKALSTAQAQEPVAYRVEHPTSGDDLAYQPLTEADKAAGWTETPLYASPSAPSTPDAREIVEQCAAIADQYAENSDWSWSPRKAPEAIANTIRAKADEIIAAPSAPDAALREAFNYLCKWVERGLFDKHHTPKEALDVIAHFPAMPWMKGRWDVDHKPYAAEFYKAFPKAALSNSGQMEKGA